MSMHGSMFSVSASYDLCEFVLTSNDKDGYYEAYDNRSTGNTEGSDAANYTYYFNVLANVAKKTPDPECDNYDAEFRAENGLPLGHCTDIVGDFMSSSGNCSDPSNIVPITNKVAAYQAKKGSEESNRQCWRLHDGKTEPIWSFLDYADPAYGIEIKYINGDFCPSEAKNREFRMQFQCVNDLEIRPEYIESIMEPPGQACTYIMRMATSKGCPTECITDNDNMCSGHGVCDFDWKRGRPKCFCYKGWYGEDCHENNDPYVEVVYEDSDNPFVGALVCVILLLVVILLILGYLFLRYTRVKNQPFDFNFLQQSKSRRSKKANVDEYDDNE